MHLDGSVFVRRLSPVCARIRARARILAACAAALLLSVLSCTDVVAPKRDERPAPVAPSLEASAAEEPEPDPEGDDVPGGLTGEVGVTDARGGGRVVLGRIQQRMLARIRVWQSAWEDRGRDMNIATPAGFYLSFTCNLKSYFAVIGDQGGLAMSRDFRPPMCTWDGSGPNPFEEYLVLFPGTAEGGRGQSWVANHCNPGCYTYGGTTTIKVTPVAQQLRVSASRPEVPVGEKVIFTAYRADGRPLPAVESWVWKPKDKSKPARTIACTHTNPVCEADIFEDGRMWATANLPFADWWYGTMWETASAKVAVLEEFELRSDKDEGFVGDTVTFEPYLNDQRVAAVRWQWVPKGAHVPPPVLAANLSASVASVDAPTSSNDLTESTDPIDPPPPVDVPECAGKDQCKRVLETSGTMWAYRVDPPSGREQDQASKAVIARPAAVVLTLALDSAELHPRIPAVTVNGSAQPEVPPGLTDVEASITRGGNPVVGVSVALRAELMPGVGGHAHVDTIVRLENAATATQGPDQNQPIPGHFRHDGAKRAAVQASTGTDGRARTRFSAGYMGARVRVIASATVDGKAVADTVPVTVRVPNLVTAEARLDTLVYWIGGTEAHPQGVNWYVRDSLLDELEDIASALRRTIRGQNYYLQYNDISLPLGGTFTEHPNPLEHPWTPHRSHNLGTDIDIAFCYNMLRGNDGGGNRRRQCSGVERVPQGRLDDAARAEGGINRVHGGNHYHIRFP
jgi:hypothetical protein